MNNFSYKSICRLIIKRYFSVFLVLNVFISCSNDAVLSPPMRIPYTVLIYMAADNSMDKDVDYTLRQIKEGVQRSAGTVVVYLDRKKQAPRLFKINQSGEEVLLKNYKEENSANATTLKRVIEETKAKVPSKEFGLVLWSHSLGWIPAGYTHNTKSVSAVSPINAYVGVDETLGNGNVNAVAFMEVDEMAKALPDGMAEYIWFDVCLMGTVEGLYQLRSKANYLIASPTEVLLASNYDASGVPYSKVLPDLFGGKLELKRACMTYFHHYESKKYQILRSATISLLETKEFGKLFTITQDILKNRLDIVENMQTRSLQIYHTQKIPSVFFDLGHFIQQITTVREHKIFDKQLKRLVVYKAATPTFMINAKDRITINPKNYSGLSTYIPLNSFKNTSSYRYYFDKMDWSKVYKRNK